MFFRTILPGVAAAALLALSIRFSTAAPTLKIRDTSSTEAISTLTDDQTNNFIKPALFAQIAYCSPPAVLSWNCGAPCEELAGVVPISGGGNDGTIPFYYVAHDTTAQSIVVTHQGTDSSNPLSVINDAEIILEPLDQTLFPGVDSSIETHDGFAKTFARTANDILGNVTAALKANNLNKVEVHGHSLGAAIAVMDAVFLRQHLDPNVTISTTVFGLPRGGNQAWANLVDQSTPGLVHIHNKNDPVGTVPPRFLDYQHPSGEVHIQADNSSVNCPGQENQDSECIDGQSILNTSVDDHFGPYYANISMGHSFCPL
ncbi:alpha/beta-hydrolase [Ramaria rubella]|nr:alpha/beta-hydrolase [Ramaria rubella]